MSAASPLSLPVRNSPSSASAAPSPTPSQPTQHAQLTLLGTLPLPLVSGLLNHLATSLVPSAPNPLYELETVLARHDDLASSVREKQDNAWAAVVRSRRATRLRVRQRLHPAEQADHTDTVACTLFLPLPPLPERQYPRVTVRPSICVEVLPSHRLSRRSSYRQAERHTTTTTSTTSTNEKINTTPFPPFSSDTRTTSPLPLPPSALNTDPTTGWTTLTSSLGWKPSFTFLRHGLEFHLDDHHPSSPSTLHLLRIYRIYRPDPTGFLPPSSSSFSFEPDLSKPGGKHDDDDDDEEWVPLDPDGSTVVVELISTVGAQLDPTPFTHPSVLASSPQPRASVATADATGVGASSAIDDAMAHMERVAKLLRGFVDLRRENVDL